MNPLDLARAVGFGVAMFLFARYIVRHRHPFKPLYPWVWVRKARKMGRRKLAKIVAVGLIFAVVALVLVPRATTTTQEALGPVVDDPTVHPASVIYRISPLLLLVFLLVMPILEEWMFRGIVLEWMLKYGRFVAVFWSSAAFAAMHFLSPGTTPLMMFPTLCGGLLFGAAYLRGGLGASTISHIGYNGLAWVLFVGV